MDTVEDIVIRPTRLGFRYSAACVWDHMMRKGGATLTEYMQYGSYAVDAALTVEAVEEYQSWT